MLPALVVLAIGLNPLDERVMIRQDLEVGQRREQDVGLDEMRLTTPSGPLKPPS